MPLSTSVTKHFFLKFYLKILARKFALYFRNLLVRFCEQKNPDKNLKKSFVTLIPEGTKSQYAIFPQTISLIMIHRTARCAVLSLF